MCPQEQLRAADGQLGRVMWASAEQLRLVLEQLQSGLSAVERQSVRTTKKELEAYFGASCTVVQVASKALGIELSAESQLWNVEDYEYVFSTLYEDIVSGVGAPPQCGARYV
jgi:hypothetical protein